MEGRYFRGELEYIIFSRCGLRFVDVRDRGVSVVFYFFFFFWKVICEGEKMFGKILEIVFEVWRKL